MIGDKVSNAYFGVRASEKEVSEKIHTGVRNYFYGKVSLVNGYKKRAYMLFDCCDRTAARCVGVGGLAAVSDLYGKLLPSRARNGKK